jgi:predicted RNA-binding protein (virulence factor B family)
MIQTGIYNTLVIKKEMDFGVYLDGGDLEILLPKRYVPADAAVGDAITVFLYHDSENRLIATTDKPIAIVGQFALLKVVDVMHQGAFLDWGLMKDLFVPKSQQIHPMLVGQEYLVYIYLDTQTDRVAATEKFESFLQNDQMDLKEKDAVSIIIYRRTDIGYVTIINHKHTGILHYSDARKNYDIGESFDGFVKAVRGIKVDVMPGKAGYLKVEDEATKIVRLLKENDGYLPYYDKSDPEAIVEFFGMSKKTFKMTIGSLYKQQKIAITQTGIQLTEA